MTLQTCRERSLRGQADLPTMGVTGQVQPVSVRRPVGDLRRVHESDTIPLRCRVKRRMCCLGLEPVDVVQAGYMYGILAPRQRNRLVQQNTNSKTFHRHNHCRAVVIAKHAEHALARLDGGNDMRQPFDQRFHWCMNIVSDIAGYNAKVMLDFHDAIGKCRRRIQQIVEMKIGQVQNAIAVEGRWQIRMRYGQVRCFKLQRPGGAPPE